MNYAQMYIL